MQIYPAIKAFSFLFLCFCGYFIFHSCNAEPESERTRIKLRSEPEHIVRMEQKLCSTDQNPESSPVEDLIEKYPIFTDVFFNEVIFPQNTRSIELDDLVNHFCASPAIQHLIDTTQVIYPDLNDLEKKMGVVNAYFEYYFPENDLPRYFSYVSEFGIGTFTVGTKVVGIGLDFFLGADYPYYDPAVFPRYRIKTMTPEYVAASAVRALVEAMVPDISTGNMLEFMIRNGKILYIASRLLPEEPMHRICLYTPEEMEWVRANEFSIWAYFLDLGYFYVSDLRKFQKFIDPAPDTPGLPKEAPGRIANWTGYKIIESYMKNHPEVEMKDLLEDTDFQKIMDQSRYKPPR